uniref:Putative secreted protein n=2 Tax=Ixodes ricinus TaxID=34613 RepID=V5IBG0_IXORI
MIRMVILPLSVVLLAASGDILAKDPKQDADECREGLGDYITTICTNSKGTFVKFSECSYTCASNNVRDQPTLTTSFLPNGLPCGRCKECCNGRCQPVKLELKNPLTLKTSCRA